MQTFDRRGFTVRELHAHGAILGVDLDHPLKECNCRPTVTVTRNPHMLTAADLPRFELDGEAFIRPDFAGRGLANVAPTVLTLLAPHAAQTLDLPPLDASVLPP